MGSTLEVARLKLHVIRIGDSPRKHICTCTWSIAGKQWSVHISFHLHRTYQCKKTAGLIQLINHKVEFWSITRSENDNFVTPLSKDVDIKVSEPRGIDPRNLDQFIGKVSRCQISKDQGINSHLLKCLEIEIIQKV